MLKSQDILKELQARYEGKAEVKLIEVKKSYGVRVGVCIKEPDKDYAPNIYLDDEKFQSMSDLEEACDEIQKLYEEHKDGIKVNLEWLNSWDMARNKILPRLVNPQACKGYLDDKPFRPFSDLALIYYLEIERDKNGSQTAVVTNDLMNAWGVGEADLFEVAGEHITPTFTDMVDFMRNSMQERGIEQELIDLMTQGLEGQMYILSNGRAHESTNGAGVLPYMMQELANRFEKFIIVPSSIHEVLILPIRGSEPVDKDDVTDMVKQVNATEVDICDRLSDHSYYWNGKELVI